MGGTVRDTDSGYVWFRRCLDALHRRNPELKRHWRGLNAAFVGLVDVFACDGVRLLDAQADTWTPVTQRTWAEYPGAPERGRRRR